MTRVLSYGGGVQTVAIITMILTGQLPRPDIIVMADTGYEVSSTFEYLDRVVKPGLSSIGMQVEVVPHSFARVDLYSTGGDILLPMYTMNNGKCGKFPTYCSSKWKRDTIRRWLRKIANVKQADMWIGLTTDELERMNCSGLKWLTNVYPLIEIVPLSRASCLKKISDFGWPTPYKSRCKICPNQSPSEWVELRNRNDGDFDYAVAKEKEIRSRDSGLFLHKLCIPVDEAVAKADLQSSFFDGCDSGYCFT